MKKKAVLASKCAAGDVVIRFGKLVLIDTIGTDTIYGLYMTYDGMSTMAIPKDSEVIITNSELTNKTRSLITAYKRYASLHAKVELLKQSYLRRIEEGN